MTKKYYIILSTNEKGGQMIYFYEWLQKKPRTDVPDREFDLGPGSGDRAGVYPTVTGEVSSVADQTKRATYRVEEELEPDESGKFNFGRGPKPTGDVVTDFTGAPNTGTSAIVAELASASASDTVPTSLVIPDELRSDDTLNGAEIFDGEDTDPALVFQDRDEVTGDYEAIPPNELLEYIAREETSPWYVEMKELGQSFLLLEAMRMHPNLDVDLDAVLNDSMKHYAKTKNVYFKSSDVRWVGNFEKLSTVIKSAYPRILNIDGSFDYENYGLFGGGFELKRSRMGDFHKRNRKQHKECDFRKPDIDYSFANNSTELVFAAGQMLMFANARPMDIFASDYSDHIPTLRQLIEIVEQYGRKFSKFFNYREDHSVLTRTVSAVGHKIVCLSIDKSGKIHLRPVDADDNLKNVCLLPIY